MPPHTHPQFFGCPSQHTAARRVISIGSSPTLFGAAWAGGLLMLLLRYQSFLQTICLIQPLFWPLTHSRILLSVTLWFLLLLVTLDDHTTQPWTSKPYPIIWLFLPAHSTTSYHPQHPQGAKKENYRSQVTLRSWLRERARSWGPGNRQGLTAPQRQVVWGVESATSCH